MTPLTLVEDVVDALRTAGVRATSDPRNVTPPCVLVELDRVDPLTSCSGRATIMMRAITPAPGSGDAIAWLWGPAFTALATISPGPISRDTFTDLPTLTAEYVGTVEWSAP